MRLSRVFFFLLCCFMSIWTYGKPPDLSSRDAKIKIEEILKAHVSHHELNTELIKRAFNNYLEEIDPGKTYLLESEILSWINPTSEQLTKGLNDYKKENFSSFETIHLLIIPAIERRHRIEERISRKELPKNVKASEFKDIKWAKTEEELEQRLLRIKALQLDAAEKLNQETKDQFIKRLEKRRFNREEELLTRSEKERHKLVLSYALKSISAALDSQTAYFTPAEANQVMIQVQQKLYGIGAQLRDDINGFTIVRLLEGGPAMASDKLKKGDKIIAVNHEPVVGMEITEAVELIRGPHGTIVLLSILREEGEGDQKQEKKYDIEIVRSEVVLKETRFETTFEPYGGGVIGVIQLFSFYQDATSSSASDLYQAIQKLKQEHNLTGIILDMRNNGGGLLPQAIAVTGLFIKKGIVVSIKDNTQMVQHLRNIEGKMVWEGPLIVLTSKASASAAEIVAQTLQDYGRAIVVGDETTYGKGTFQTFTLEASNYGKINPKGEFKVTRGRYYTVSGKSPQLVGVKADIVIPGIYSELEIGEKFSKYPLDTDLIPPNFDDDLQDIPAVHRNQLLRLYKFNLQTVLTQYRALLPTLQKNSQNRIQMNKNYQAFLKEISKKDFPSDSAESFGQNDLQFAEALNVMKDLIFLSQENAVDTPIAATGTEG